MGPSASLLHCSILILFLSSSLAIRPFPPSPQLSRTGPSSSHPLSISSPPPPPPDPTPHIPVTTVTIPPPSPQNSTQNSTTGSLDICLDCVTFMNNNLDALIKIIDRIGVTDTCEKICGQLNITADIALCETLCNTIGVTMFWQMFLSAGINGIWACEMVNACKVGQNPAATFTLTGVTPSFGDLGTTFEFKMQFTVINETGVGEAAFVVYYPVGNEHQLGFIAEQVFPDYPPGNYEINMSFPTNSSFNTGRYLVVFDLCSGSCGQNPDPYPFASDEYAFNITATP